MTVRVVAIGEVATINPRQPARPVADNASVPFIPMAAVREDGSTPTEECRLIADVKSGYTYFERGDILLAKITPCFENGKAALLDSLSHHFGFGSTEFHVLRAGPDLDPRYLYHAVRSPQFRRSGSSRMTGSAGQRRVPAAFVRGYRIPLPSLAEQRRMATVLDRTDKIALKREESLSVLDQVLPAAFLTMFGDPVSNARRWPHVNAASAIKEIEAGTSMKGKATDQDSTLWSVLKVSAVTSGWYLPKESKPVSLPPEDPIVPKRGDLLFSRANTRELVGATCLVHRGSDHVFLPDKLWKISPNQGIATAEYLRFLFANPGFRRLLARRATGTSGSMLNISQEKVLQLSLPIPPLSLQYEFSSILWKLIAVRKSIHEASHHTERLSRSLGYIFS